MKLVGECFPENGFFWSGIGVCEGVLEGEWGKCMGWLTKVRVREGK